MGQLMGNKTVTFNEARMPGSSQLRSRDEGWAPIMTSRGTVVGLPRLSISIAPVKSSILTSQQQFLNSPRDLGVQKAAETPKQPGLDTDGKSIKKTRMKRGVLHDGTRHIFDLRPSSKSYEIIIT